MSTTLSKTSAGTTAAGRGTTFLNVLRSEWTKFWTVRSTLWTLVAAVVVTIGFSALFAVLTVANWDQIEPQDRASIDVTNSSLGGLLFGQLAVAVLGVLVISAEYSTGGVRSTFVAVPRRLQVLASKALVTAATALAVGLVTCFVSFAICRPIYGIKDLHASIGDPGVLRALVGGGLYVAGTAMLGLAIGTVLRHSAGSITAAVGVLFVLPLLLFAVPGDTGDAIRKFAPSNAGSAISSVMDNPDQLSPWTGYAVFTLEWLVVLVIGAALLKRRDA